MPQHNVNETNAMDYVYRNINGWEWILIKKTGPRTWEYEYTSHTPDYVTSRRGIWQASDSTLRRFAHRKTDQTYSESNLINKVKEMEQRFNNRKVMHG